MNQQPKQKPRFNSEQEIIDAIEAAKKKADECDKKASDLDELKKGAAANAAKMEQEGTPASAEFWRDQMNEYKLKAGKLRTTATHLRDSKMKYLSDRLADFRTEPMNFLAGDSSIQR